MKGAFAVIIRSESLCGRLSIPMEKEKFASLRRSQELTFESAFNDKKVQHRKMLNLFLVGEGGFEPPKALLTDLQSAPFGHSGIPPYEIVCLSVELVDGFEPPTC